MVIMLSLNGIWINQVARATDLGPRRAARFTMRALLAEKLVFETGAKRQTPSPCVLAGPAHRRPLEPSARGCRSR